MTSQRKKLLTAVVGITISELVGLAGATFTRGGVRDWYPKLRKPSFTPPSWIFGPVWTTLYALMGLAISSVWQRRRETSKARGAIALFFAQLGLNAAWSFAFFKLRSAALGMVVVVPLWFLIAATIVAFMPISWVAGLLLIPYLVWTTLAVALNLRIWELNRGRRRTARR